MNLEKVIQFDGSEYLARTDEPCKATNSISLFPSGRDVIYGQPLNKKKRNFLFSSTDRETYGNINNTPRFHNNLFHFCISDKDYKKDWANNFLFCFIEKAKIYSIHLFSFHFTRNLRNVKIKFKSVWNLQTQLLWYQIIRPKVSRKQSISRNQKEVPRTKNGSRTPCWETLVKRTKQNRMNCFLNEYFTWLIFIRHLWELCLLEAFHKIAKEFVSSFLNKKMFLQFLPLCCFKCQTAKVAI